MNSTNVHTGYVLIMKVIAIIIISVLVGAVFKFVVVVAVVVVAVAVVAVVVVVVAVVGVVVVAAAAVVVDTNLGFLFVLNLSSETYLITRDKKRDVFVFFLAYDSRWKAINGEKELKPEQWDQHESRLEASPGKNRHSGIGCVFGCCGRRRLWRPCFVYLVNSRKCKLQIKLQVCQL